jgi:cold shock CspA family protein
LIELKGTIIKWFRYRGYGFIEPEEEEGHIFCQISEINYEVDPLEGQEVKFEVEPTWKGLKAVDVNLIENN